MQPLSAHELQIARDLRIQGKTLTSIARTIRRREKAVSRALGVYHSYAPKAGSQARPEFDRICKELNACVPAGGCRYPYCECKA